MADYTPIELARAGRRLDMAFAGMHLEISGRMDMTQAELLAIAQKQSLKGEFVVLVAGPG